MSKEPSFQNNIFKTVCKKVKDCFKNACLKCKQLLFDVLEFEKNQCTCYMMMTYIFVYILWKMALRNSFITSGDIQVGRLHRRLLSPVTFNFMKRNFTFSLDQLRKGEIIPLIGCNFSHFHFNNLAQSLLGMLAFGGFVEQSVGYLGFLGIVLFTGFVSHLLHSLAIQDIFNLNDYMIVGANGSILGLIGFAIVFCYDQFFYEWSFILELFAYSFIISKAWINDAGKIHCFAGLLAGFIVGILMKMATLLNYSDNKENSSNKIVAKNANTILK